MENRIPESGSGPAGQSGKGRRLLHRVRRGPIRSVLYLAPAAVLMLWVAGCGDPDKAALARSTISSYWSDVAHAKFNQSYKLLTAGVQETTPLNQYSSNMFGFLTNTANIKVDVGKPVVDQDRAVVPIIMHSPRTTVPFHAYQHLFWENGAWRISDANGGLSHNPHP